MKKQIKKEIKSHRRFIQESEDLLYKSKKLTKQERNHYLNECLKSYEVINVLEKLLRCKK